MAILPRIKSPSDVSRLDPSELPELAEEIRERIIDVTSKNGGHIGPNLGVVELTIGLHRVFNCPEDKFVWDVSHQGYVHKLLSGREGEDFDNIRMTDGLSGFLRRAESPYDAYGAGHAGTALSAALGMAAARDHQGKDHSVVAVLGDAAFTCGITMEALNNVAATTKNFILILNDNEWSIAKNVGALAHYFNELITNPVYNRIDKRMKKFFEGLPGGQSVVDFTSKWKRETKDFIVDSNLFEHYGMRYIGPVDGHDLDAVVKHLEFAKNSQDPIILHLLTKKGRGYEPALEAPEKFHGLGPFDRETGKSPAKKSGPPNYQDAFGKNLLKFAEADNRIMGITAAMPPGTGLVYLREARPKQFVDVGIAEEHAVLFAAGMACDGLRPVVAIYSTFLQRAYDCIIHDVCLQNLPVVFCMDRAGLSPQDGATHHGLFDIAYLRCVPNTVIMQPANEDELADMLWTGLQHNGPSFIRYPRGAAEGVPCKANPSELQIGKAQVVREGLEVQFWALGPWVKTAETLAGELAEELGISIGVVNGRFAKPLDIELLEKQAATANLFITFEDHAITGGFGTAVIEALTEIETKASVKRIGFPDEFVEHGSTVEDVRKLVGLDLPTLRARLRKMLESLSMPEKISSSD